MTQARALLNYLQAQPEGGAPQWQDFVRDCLTSAVAGTRRFATLSPHLTEPTDPAVVKFSDFLTGIAETLTDAHEKVAGDEPVSFVTQIDAYTDTLHNINALYLGAGKSLR